MSVFERCLTVWVLLCIYKVIDVLRVKSAREALHVPQDDELEVFAASATDASDLRRDLERLFATLPDGHCLPIVHVKQQALSVAETAVKVGIHRGLKPSR